MSTATATEDKIKGTVHRIKYQNGPFAIFELRVKQEYIPCKGNFPGIKEGEVVEFEGEWEWHETFGKQFKFKSFNVAIPNDIGGIAKWLATHFEGVGQAHGLRLAEAFGDRIFEPGILQDVAAMSEVISHKLAESIAEQAEEVFSKEEERELVKYLTSFGVSDYQIGLIWQAFKKNARERIESNPYCLVEVSGIAFRTADSIAKRMGIETNDYRRRSAAIYWILDSAAKGAGHVWLTVKQIDTELRKLDICLEELEVKSLLTGYTNIYFDGERAGLEIYRKKSENAAGKLTEISNSHFQMSCMPEMDDLNDKQKLAVKAALENSVLVITGNPGTGKTYTIQRLLQIFPEEDTALCAPTGKAAKRMEEMTMREATTIHRLLGSDQLGKFFFCEENPLTAKYIIADEMSMVDIELFDSLVQAIPEGGRLIMVGDIDQLPPVGPGNPLRDVIHSRKLPVVRLDEIVRQKLDSLIVTNAHAIIKGTPPTFGAPGSDFVFWEEEDPEAIADKVVKSVLAAAKARGYDPIYDIQVISPMKRGPIGTKALNDILRKVLNPRAQGRFDVGDKVMQIRNNYKLGVFNGDWGVVEDVQKGEDPGLWIRWSDNVGFFYPAKYLGELVLSYAITVHKSQGSEFKCVIMPMHTTHYIMLQRNLLYTAITRAKEVVGIVGTEKAINTAVRTNKQNNRNTWMKEFLK